jgi:tRNA-uridine 2-sulfurtransferase
VSSDSHKPARILVAMSGGVDSSVTAALVQESGAEAVGVTLRLQPGEPAEGGGACSGLDGLTAARAVAAKLGMTHHVLGGEQEFDSLILRPAWEEYARGRTPSPCLACNERIKFGLLWQFAERLGATAIATGHYARLEHSPDGSPLLCRGLDAGKDQSYFLARLTPAQLGRTLFPLGALKKSAVRELARQRGLPTAERPDSQDACFVAPGESLSEILRRRFAAPSRPGPIVDAATGAELGRHTGIHGFTIGQRRGLGVALPSRGWVKAIDAASATVTITRDEQALCSKSLLARDANWLEGREPEGPLACQVQVRYRHAPVHATLTPLCEGRLRVDFAQPVKAVAPGQAAVFYRGDVVFASAWIDAAE